MWEDHTESEEPSLRAGLASSPVTSPPGGLCTVVCEMRGWDLMICSEAPGRVREIGGLEPHLGLGAPGGCFQLCSGLA